MPNKEIVVVESQPLREEVKMECKNFITDCLQNAKAPAKRLAASAIERGVEWFINFLFNEPAA